MNLEYKNDFYHSDNIATWERLWKASVKKSDPVRTEFVASMYTHFEKKWDDEYKVFGERFEKKHIKSTFLKFLKQKIEKYIAQIREKRVSKAELTYLFGTWQLTAPSVKVLGRILGIYKDDTEGIWKMNFNLVGKVFLKEDWFSFELRFELTQMLITYPDYVWELAGQLLLQAEKTRATALLLEEKTQTNLTEDDLQIPALVKDLQIADAEQDLSPVTQSRLLDFLQQSSLFQQLHGIGHIFLKQWANDAIRSERQKRNQRLLWWSVPILLLLAGSLVYWNKPKPRFTHIYTPAEIGQIQFKILDKDIGINQSSFKIYYDFGKLPKPDTLIISGQGGNGGSHWEITPKHLTKSKDTVRVLFYKPITHIMLDVRQPTLQTLKKILMPTPSSGWIAWTYGMNPITTKDNWVSSYRPTCQILQKGMMYYNPEGLSKTQKDYYHTDYVNSRDFGIKGEECTAEVRLKCPPKIAEGSCMGYGLSLIGEENDINFAPIQAGCSYYLGTKVGHTSYHNSYDVVRYEKGKLITTQPFVGDIAGLTPPVSITEDWHIWKLQVKQGIAYYYLNDKLVYEHSYQGSIGNIKMFAIHFKGAGWVDWVRLYDAQDREVYFEDFEDCKKPAKVKRNL